MAVSSALAPTPARPTLAIRIRTAGWLGWQIESN